MTIICATATRLDACITRASAGFNRLIGIAILRIVIGIAGVQFYVSDYVHREFLWGPNSYNSLTDASHQLRRGQFSLYFLDDSNVWFNVVFHLGLAAAIGFTIFGGRWLTLVHAVMLWSIYLRNQDILEGGDNLARILMLFMAFTVSNAYFAPGAKQRRVMLESESVQRPVIPLLHNAAATAMLVQIATVYFVAGYLKATGEIWTNGTAMYYISRIHQFSMFAWYPQAMNNAYLGWAVNYFTIIVEIAVPFVIWSKRATIRKLVTVSLEGMHVGIMVFMGLAAFGLIMIGADSMILTDHDYQTLTGHVRRVTASILGRLGRSFDPPIAPTGTPPMTPSPTEPRRTRPTPEQVGV